MVSQVTFSKAANSKTISTRMSTPASRLFRTRTRVGTGSVTHREKMGTFWYHDHRQEFTLNSNVLGLNGMYIVYDRTDPGHEHPSATARCNCRDTTASLTFL